MDLRCTMKNYPEISKRNLCAKINPAFDSLSTDFFEMPLFLYSMCVQTEMGDSSSPTHLSLPS